MPIGNVQRKDVIRDWIEPPSYSVGSGNDCRYRQFWEAGRRIVQWQGQIDLGADVTGLVAPFTPADLDFGAAQTFYFVFGLGISNGSQTGLITLWATPTGSLSIAPDFGIASGTRFLSLDTLRYEFVPL